MHSNYINIPISDLKITTLVVLLSEQGGRRMEKYTFEKKQLKYEISQSGRLFDPTHKM